MPGAKAPGILLRRRRACAFPVGCRGGFHIRPQTLIPPRTRRDEGVPPYVLPDGRNRPFCLAHLPSFAGNSLDRPASPCAAAGRAGISGLRAGPYGLWPPKRACGRSGIGPYRGLRYRLGARFPGWPPCFPSFRRAGDFARRTSANSKRTFRRLSFKNRRHGVK